MRVVQWWKSSGESLRFVAGAGGKKMLLSYVSLADTRTHSRRERLLAASIRSHLGLAAMTGAEADNLTEVSL